MTNLAYVTVTANKNAAIRDDARTCTTVNAHQNRVFAVLARTKVVLRQRQRANIVTNKAGQLEALFQRLNQPPVLYLNMRHVANNAAFRVNQPGKITEMAMSSRILR